MKAARQLNEEHRSPTGALTYCPLLRIQQVFLSPALLCTFPRDVIVMVMAALPDEDQRPRECQEHRVRVHGEGLTLDPCEMRGVGGDPA
jgi:hypothetical protein